LRLFVGVGGAEDRAPREGAEDEPREMQQERKREELPAHRGEVVRKDADGVEEAPHASSVGRGQAPAATSTQSVAKPSAIPSRTIQVTMIGIEKRRQTFASSSTT